MCFFPWLISFILKVQMKERSTYIQEYTNKCIVLKCIKHVHIKIDKPPITTLNHISNIRQQTFVIRPTWSIYAPTDIYCRRGRKAALADCDCNASQKRWERACSTVGKHDLILNHYAVHCPQLSQISFKL